MSIIARDNQVTVNLTGPTALSQAFTCSGLNRLLVVMATSVSTDWTGFTYNGVALTQIQSAITPNNKISLWYLINPASGSHTLAGTWPGNQGHSVVVQSYSGVNQSSPINTSTTNSGSGTSLTTSITTNTNQCWGILAGGSGGVTTLTAGTNSSLIDTANTNGNLTEGFFDSNGDITPAGNFSMTFNGANASKGAIMAGIAPIDVSSLFWVGGTGTWDGSTKTNWATSSGGTGGAAVPQLSSSVIFDSNSGGGTSTISATSTIISATFTGYTGTFAGSSALNLASNLTLGSGMTVSYSGTVTFNSTASGKTITTSGKTILGPLVFNGVGGVWTLQDNTTSSSILTVTNGTLNFNGKNVTATTASNAGTITTGNGTLSFTTFTNTGTLTLGSGTMSLTGTGTVWTGGGTLTANTSTLKITDTSSSSKTFSGGSMTYYNLWITGSGTGTYTIVGSNTFNDFKVDTPPHTVNFTATTTQSLQTFTVSGTAGNLMTLQSTSPGTAWHLLKLNSSSVVCDYLSLQDSHVTSL